MKKFFLALSLSLLALPALAVLPTQDLANLSPQKYTSVSVANATSATTVKFTAPSSGITIFVTPGGSNAYFNFGAAATTNNFEVPAGYSLVIDGFPQLSISVIADGTSGKTCILAH